ncbi:response regulator [Chloroflexales bacterium ZM16-3]|nr:response regulator [Chloroflexales bacterium ZM16-3]
MSTEEVATLTEQLQLARKEAGYYRKLAQECGERRLKESEELSSLIAQLRQTEMVLMQARDEADAANRAKSQFLATMSHELRTPLTAIIGYSQLMEQLVIAGDYRTVETDLHRIYAAGRHLLSLINTVLDLSRIEAGQLQFDAERVNVPYIVGTVTETIMPLIEQNHNTLEVICPAHIVTMYTDPLKVRQSLLNLLGNAAKFTKAGTIRLTVTQEQVDGVDWVSFAVADSGIGISADQISKLFKPFSQVDDSLNRRYDGSGLGLVLSQRLCQLLGGDITMESTFGVGSVFTMRLPAIAPTEPVLHIARPSPAERAPDEEVPVVSDNIVLVIDADPAVGSLIAHLIGPERACVIYAASGAEGIELAHDVLPELIFLNVLMPDRDGWQLLEALKTNPDLAHIPVVMISIDNQQQRGLALGVADFITKPIDQDAVASALRWLPAPTHTSGYILVVEGDHALAELYQRTLEGAGWRVVIARTGREALTAITTHPPAAIMLDLLLPDMDGVHLINTLRERPGRVECPTIIVISSDLSNADRAQVQGSTRQILRNGAHTFSELTKQLHCCLATHSSTGLKKQTEPPHG